VFIYNAPGITAFASEPRALHALPAFSAELNVDALAMYFRYLYVPAPHSIYARVTKLLPGHVLEWTEPGAALPESTPYWSVDEVARRERSVPFEGSDADYVDALESVLLDAVRLRLRADVPVGAFLSGGVDSSTVVALMQEVSPTPARTFTIGFDVAAHDESSEAAAVARHLGTDHR